MRLQLKGTNKSKKFWYPYLPLSIIMLSLGIYLGWNKDMLGSIKANLLLLKDSGLIYLFSEPNHLKNITLNVKFKNIQKIEDKRNDALKKGLLVSSDDDFVKATISQNNADPMECKIRLKGDLPQHWSGSKWSLRVHLKSQNLLDGMSRFSLQDPITRNYTREWLFHNNLRYEKILAPRYEFVNLTINGKEMGIYAVEEFFSKQMIEDQKRREGLFLNFDEHYMWNCHWNISWPTTWRSTGIEIRNRSRIEHSETLLEQSKTAINLLRQFQERELSPEQVFNVDKMGKFLALSQVWGSEHGLSYVDMNFYYDPITAKIEPVGMDAKPSQSPSFENYFCEGEMEDSWVNHMLRSPHICKSYISYLDKFTKPSYLSKLKNEFQKKEQILRKLLLKDLFFEDKHFIWRAKNLLVKNDAFKILDSRMKNIRRGLDEKKIALLYASHSENDSKKIKITARNALTQPIEIISFEVNDKIWSAKDVLKSSSSKKMLLCPQNINVVIPLKQWSRDTPNNDIYFYIPYDGNRSIDEKMKIKAKVRILGLENSTETLVNTDALSRKISVPHYPNNEDLLDTFPFIEKNGLVLTIPSGNYDVEKDLIVPPDHKLIIKAGTKLNFSNDCLLYSNGALDIQGNKDKLVIMTSNEMGWGGVVVANASERSNLQYLHFSRAKGIGPTVQSNGINREGWTLTGGMTFYESDVDVLNCKFHDSSSEDALNIISSNFSLLGSSFSKISSDAFDGDFVQGVIKDCNFKDIGGDGVDFSGSNVSIANCNFFDVNDKAVSIGENSSAEILKCGIKNVSFGIVSKDLSNTEVKTTYIDNANVASFAAFQKKKAFGPASISVENSYSNASNKDFLIQEESSGYMNGSEILTEHFETSSLY